MVVKSAAAGPPRPAPPPQQRSHMSSNCPPRMTTPVPGCCQVPEMSTCAEAGMLQSESAAPAINPARSQRGPQDILTPPRTVPYRTAPQQKQDLRYTATVCPLLSAPVLASTKSSPASASAA